MPNATNPLIGFRMSETLECNAVMIAVSEETGRVFVSPFWEYDPGLMTAAQQAHMLMEFAIDVADKNGGGSVIAEWRFTPGE